MKKTLWMELDQIQADAVEAENQAMRELMLKAYSSGYQAGHHDTVEGIFTDDPRGNDAEYYHGDAVDELITDEIPTPDAENEE